MIPYPDWKLKFIDKYMHSTWVQTEHGTDWDKIRNLNENIKNIEDYSYKIIGIAYNYGSSEGTNEEVMNEVLYMADILKVTGLYQRYKDIADVLAYQSQMLDIEPLGIVTNPSNCIGLAMHIVMTSILRISGMPMPVDIELNDENDPQEYRRKHRDRYIKPHFGIKPRNAKKMQSFQEIIEERKEQIFGKEIFENKE